MSYAGDVARGIQEQAGKAADEIVMTDRESLERMIDLIDREIQYRAAADVFEFSEQLWWQGKKSDDACNLVQIANKPKRKNIVNVPVRQMDW